MKTTRLAVIVATAIMVFGCESPHRPPKTSIEIKVPPPKPDVIYSDVKWCEGVQVIAFTVDGCRYFSTLTFSVVPSTFGPDHCGRTSGPPTLAPNQPQCESPSSPANDGDVK